MPACLNKSGVGLVMSSIHKLLNNYLHQQAPEKDEYVLLFQDCFNLKHIYAESYWMRTRYKQK